MSASISTLDEMAAAKPRSIVSLRLLIRVSVLWQLIGLYNTWSHVSDHPAVLGRYSYGYAAVLLLSLLIALVWLALLLLPRRAEALLRGLSPRLRYALLLLPLLGLVPMWFTGVEFNAQHYLSMSWFWFAALLIRSQTDQAVRLRRWFIGLGLGLLVVMIPIAITALTARPFSPDEALWASIGYSLFSHGGLYSYTNLAPAWIITPGFGWSVGGYGWALTHLAFSPFVGRLWNLIGFWLAFAGIGLVTARLYGRAAGWVSAGVAALGMYFITALDYRPSHQLEATVMLILLVLLQARFSRGRARGWHWLTGLLVGLSLQMHAAAIVYVFGFSLFYLLDAVWRLYHQRDVAALLPLCWYGLGALIGGGLFYLFNILPAGGVDVYLATLAGDRWGTERILRFLYVSSRFDVFLSLLAIGYLIWRRNASDRLFLALLLPVLLGMALLDSQGYREPYLALYAIPVGTMLVHGLRTEGIQPGHNRHSVWTVACLLLVAAGMWSPAFIHWDLVQQTLRAGQLPPYEVVQLGEAIRPYTRPGDVILSTHELIWEFHQPGDQLYSVNAESEIFGPQSLQVDNAEAIWRHIAPTVIVYIQSRMSITPSLQRYMDETGFQACTQFDAVGDAVTIYRVNC